MLPRTFLFMLVCAGIGYLLGRSRGMGMQGFFLGFAFGPLGWGLIMLWPRKWIQGPLPRETEPPGEGNRARYRHSPDAAKGCPRCGRPVAAQAAVCSQCGNVLVPIRYQVNSG